MRVSVASIWQIRITSTLIRRQTIKGAAPYVKNFKFYLILMQYRYSTTIRSRRYYSSSLMFYCTVTVYSMLFTNFYLNKLNLFPFKFVILHIIHIHK